MLPARRCTVARVRALILHGPGDLRLERVPDPEPGPGELVVRVDVALTCATDAKMMRSGDHPALGPLPAPLGHELAGTVVAAGAGAPLAAGARVVVANSAPCGACRACARGRPSLCADIAYLTGAFAELVRVPARIARVNAVPLPDGLGPELAALAEPLACAVHGAERCGAAPGDDVLVLGGGLQGVVIAALLSRRGCRVGLCDPHGERRARALRFGVAEALPAPRDEAGRAAARAFTGGRGADVVVEAVGRVETWTEAVALAGPGAEVLLHGGCPAGTHVRWPTAPLHYRELTLRGSYHHTPAAVRRALALIEAGELPVAELLGPPVSLPDVPAALASGGEKRPVHVGP